MKKSGKTLLSSEIDSILRSEPKVRVLRNDDDNDISYDDDDNYWYDSNNDNLSVCLVLCDLLVFMIDNCSL